MVSMSFGKLAGIIIGIVALIILMEPIVNDLLNGTENNVDTIKLQKQIIDCELTPNFCNVKNCDNDDIFCTDIEKQEWTSQLYFKEYCDSNIDSLTDKEKEQCSGVLYKKVEELLGQSSSGNNPGGSTGSGNTQNIASITSFAKTHGIEECKIYAIFEKESRGKYFDSNGKPITRFECTKFNKNSQKQAPCTTQDSTGKQIYGLTSETNRAAFESALKSDKDNAIKWSSFGIAQILGDNYKLLGYQSTDDFYNKFNTEEGQIEVFLQFLQKKNNGNILTELKKTNTNWNAVALNYNGNNYQTNNYHIDIEKNYNTCKNQQSTPQKQIEEYVTKLKQEIDSSNIDGRKKQITQKALEEYKNWEYGNMQETDPKAYQYLEKYWKKTNLQTWTPSGTAWSAAFISYIEGNFNAASHSTYINRIYNNQDKNWNFYAINIKSLEVGDIVCKTRNKAEFNPSNSYTSHCDVVVSAKNNKAKLIGGNVKDSVTMVEIDIDNNNKITSPSSEYIGILS